MSRPLLPFVCTRHRLGRDKGLAEYNGGLSPSSSAKRLHCQFSIAVDRPDLIRRAPWGPP
jgi:hypothetical protein